MGCNCGKPKCKGQCGCKSPAVLQINNPAEYITFHKVKIPASMGDSTTNPPRNGAYRNTLVWYEADNTSWMYSTDGIPTEITGPRGPQGEQGPAGTIEIGTTTTGEAGTDAEVENVGTPENAILNFTIPKGDKGEQGETGPQGYMNEQDVRDVVNTIVPEGFFNDAAKTVSGEGNPVTLAGAANAIFNDMKIYGSLEQSGSPTPENPVEVKIATGLQTVTITNGEDTNVYSFNLGETELGVINSYRDSIQRNNDGEWILTKRIASHVFDGDTDIDQYFFNTDLTDVVAVNLVPFKVDQAVFKPSSGAAVYSDMFSYTASSTVHNFEHIYLTQAASTSGGWFGNIRLYIAHSRLSGYSSSMTNSQKLQLVVDWLSDNPLTVYYIMKKGTTTKISDAALVNRLDALYDLGTMNDDNTITVSGDLPVNLGLSAYVENWAGTIAGINDSIENTYTKNEIDNLPTSSLVFDNITSASFSEEDLYAGYDHTYLQGFCYVNGNAICAIRSYQNYEDYVRLAEINLATGSVVREAYLELAHANSLSYREDTRKIYVAACNRSVSGGTTPDDRIFVVDYDDFSIEKTIVLSNLPSGHRIRSVWYDNDNGVLYGGDTWDMFVIDEDGSVITETIELDKTYIDTSATNQTLKRYGDYYIGIYISFIAIWNLNRKLIRIINIGLVQDHEEIGEIEDAAFDEAGNIIIGTAHKPSARLPYREVSFFKSNISKNSSNFFGLLGSDTTSVNVHVNSNSTFSEEKGTSSRPFKSLQRAVNFSRNFNRDAVIVIHGGSYQYVYINGHSRISFNIAEDTTIDGLEIIGSNFGMWNSSDSAHLTINGIYASDSLVDIRFYNSQNLLTITPNTHQDTSGYGLCALGVNGHMYFYNANFVGNNTNNLVRFSDNCVGSLRECTFSNYDGYYAVHGTTNAIITTYELVLNKTVSSTEHNFFVEKGARLYHRGLLRNKNNFVIQSQAMVYPTMGNITPEHQFYGDLCDIDTHYSHVMFEVKIGGGTYLTKSVSFEIDRIQNAVIDTSWVNNTGTRTCNLTIVKDNGKFKISDSRCLYRANDGTVTYDTLSNNSPSTPSDWAAINQITFYSI